MALYNGSGKILPKTHHLTFPSSKNTLEPPRNLIDLTMNSAYLTGSRWILKITILGVQDALQQWDLEQRRVLEGQTYGNTVTPFGWHAHYFMIVYDNFYIGYDMAIWYVVIYNCSRYMFEVTQAALHDRWLKSYRISFHMYLNWWPVLYMTQQQGEERSKGVSWVMSIHDQQIQWSHLGSIKLTMSEPTSYIWNTNRFFVACEFMLNFYLHNFHCRSSILFIRSYFNYEVTDNFQTEYFSAMFLGAVLIFASEGFGQIWFTPESPPQLGLFM